MSAARGAFTIAAVEGVTLTKWTRAWEERMPGIPLTVVRTTAHDQLEALAIVSAPADPALAEAPDPDAAQTPVADVAFVRLPIEDESLSVIPLYEEAAYVVVPKDHPASAFDSLTLADLAGETMLEGGWASAVELVGANVGVVLVPQSIARLYARNDVVAREVTDAPTTRIALVWPEERTTEEVEAFVGIVRGRTARSSRSSTNADSQADARSLRDTRSSAAAKGAAAAGGAGGRTGRTNGRAQRQSAAEARAAANRRKRTRGA